MNTQTKWRVRYLDAGKALLIDANCQTVAEFPATTSETERLICSLAPEMAEALREIHTWLISPATDKETLAFFQAKCAALLARLEGGVS